MDLSIKLDVFEGPMDLLLHLIEKNKVNIYDIPIVEITKQYLDYVHEMQRQDLNIVSEFLLMAATLLNIKAKMLLPPDKTEEGEEIDPRDELVRQLLEYKMYKYMSYELKDRMVDAQKSMFKKQSLPKSIAEYKQPVDLDILMQDITLARLNEIFQSILKRQEDKIDPVRSKFGKLEKEEVNLSEKITDLENYAIEHKKFRFSDFIIKQNTKMQKIVSFLAVLELMKSGKLHVEQDAVFGDIFISYKENV